MQNRLLPPKCLRASFIRVLCHVGNASVCRLDSGQKTDESHPRHHPWFLEIPAEIAPKAEHLDKERKLTVRFLRFAAVPC